MGCLESKDENEDDVSCHVHTLFELNQHVVWSDDTMLITPLNSRIDWRDRTQAKNRTCRSTDAKDFGCPNDANDTDVAEQKQKTESDLAVNNGNFGPEKDGGQRRALPIDWCPTSSLWRECFRWFSANSVDRFTWFVSRETSMDLADLLSLLSLGRSGFLLLLDRCRLQRCWRRHQGPKDR